MQPLVVTLAVDDEHQSRFDAERARYFPAGHTQVGAHVTLFHALPGDRLQLLAHLLRQLWDRAPFEVAVPKLVSLGRGVAYQLRSTELAELHEWLAWNFRGGLTAQDAQGFRPHITIQNKVSAEQAGRTIRELASGFEPFTVMATGVDVWRYAGGPWEPIERFPFGAGYG